MFHMLYDKETKTKPKRKKQAENEKLEAYLTIR